MFFVIRITGISKSSKENMARFHCQTALPLQELLPQRTPNAVSSELNEVTIGK
jgi:hypothetical protein